MSSELRAGALRYWSDPTSYRHGEWVVASPGDPLYSTVTMLAEEYWSVAEQRWIPITYPDDESCSPD